MESDIRERILRPCAAARPRYGVIREKSFSLRRLFTLENLANPSVYRRIRTRTCSPCCVGEMGIRRRCVYRRDRRDAFRKRSTATHPVSLPVFIFPLSTRLLLLFLLSRSLYPFISISITLPFRSYVHTDTVGAEFYG